MFGARVRSPDFLTIKIKTMETWKFIYTTESSYKKAVFKNGSLKRGKSKFVIIYGDSYSDCYKKAITECHFNEHQLIGSYKTNTPITNQLNTQP